MQYSTGDSTINDSPAHLWTPHCDRRQRTTVSAPKAPTPLLMFHNEAGIRHAMNQIWINGHQDYIVG